MKRMEGKSTGKKVKSGYGIDDEEDDEDPEPVLEPLAINYIGCYGGEDDFGGKEYRIILWCKHSLVALDRQREEEEVHCHCSCRQRWTFIRL